MYPTVHDTHRYSAEGHPVTIPASGVPEHSPAPPYAPPYITATTSLPRALPAQGQWTTGLCHCFDDPVNCFITCFCPCITFGQTSEILVLRGGCCLGC
ncbi:hypothetical protein SLEP1_g32389 [Rubroshorea leprosula]|uniref:Uncharacterized protein n=1 Tax=Rubroshorea leprosula TaxID=152421 RepID=A0AAV5KD59_9ROSI|nr:hypothetical protein SLEP1_g32389 [Rubroshorea leprosula]